MLLPGPLYSQISLYIVKNIYLIRYYILIRKLLFVFTFLNKKVTSHTIYLHLILMQPKVVSDTEDAELAKQLEKLEEANKEVAGDDEDENDD